MFVAEAAAVKTQNRMNGQPSADLYGRQYLIFDIFFACGSSKP
jgi:hypothetical protein